MLRCLRDVVRRWFGCQRGVGAVEFAVAAPVTFMFVLGVMDISTILFVDTLLEGGLRQASRFGITGQAPETGTREDAIKQVVVDNGLGFLEAEKVKLETKSYGSFGAVSSGETYTDENGNGEYDDGEAYDDANGNGVFDGDPGVPGAGGAGDVVMYRVSYDWPVMTGWIAPLLGGADGKVSLTASIAVRNEPF